MTTTPGQEPDSIALDLDQALAALRGDYTKLSARIRALSHPVKCDCAGVNLRLHFPSFRQSKATVFELVEAVATYLAPFALPKSELNALYDTYNKISAEDFTARAFQLLESAKSLFKRANKATNRNGEAGELLLCVLTEWILEAPQIIAKMSLKTNAQMPVHGADGVHVRYSKDDGRLYLYWGESKIYADVEDAIKAAVRSITGALHPEKQKHEIELVHRNLDFSGLNSEAKSAILKFLDPFDDTYNERHDVITCLIGFDFDAFATVASIEAKQVEAEFAKRATEKLTQLAPKLAAALSAAGLKNQPIEIFFFPVPSVQELRDIFQEKIGWTQ